MDPERWQQIDKLLDEVLDREPDQRQAFLEQACSGDEDLRKQVEALLAAHEKAGSFIGSPAIEVAARMTGETPEVSLVGRRLGACQVLSLLGKGGMGEVYLAPDSRLDRQVALKVLPLEVTRDPDRLKRFVREAKAASALNHPNIATIHELGEGDGFHYILMEYVKGETLEARIRRHRLELAEMLDIGIQIADALEEAHGQGITHRDIKPANIMLTPRGQVKVLDFGLAKMTRPETPGQGTATLTVSETTQGVIMGTLPYMAPEQLLGQPADARSDLWALGVVLYELLSGKHPFRRETEAATLGAILHEAPVSLASVAPSVPSAVEGIVRRCLEKRQEERFQGAHDLVVALKAVAAGAPALEVRAAWVEERSPYPGLSSFTEKDAAHFFGREAEVEALWQRLENHRLLAIIGPSGTGKTSFVRAGVIPAARPGWRCLWVTPGNRPFAAVTRALVPELSNDPETLQRLVGQKRARR